jgi:hypothetical protein
MLAFLDLFFQNRIMNKCARKNFAINAYYFWRDFDEFKFLLIKTSKLIFFGTILKNPTMQ